ncbi:MAG: tRNA (guanosine(37)-N1)-methyltransferase TrmD [Ignavibacteriales bacterium]|nr:tRNA (guanosine(37)-N1)-methyltransferase TrmD [Ignavibacteriales bacterium]
MSIRIDILSVVPRLLESPLNESILKRAQEKGLAEIVVHDIRDYTHDKHHIVDEPPYGGGAGMILKPEPIFECIESLAAQRTYDEIIYVTADGEQFTQRMANQFSLAANIIILCGHYKGIDDRIRQKLITREISIGDYVLTGGELAGLVMTDAILRLVPGVIGDGESALTDSFQDGLLDCPHYTRPPEFRGMKIPDVLLSGNHKDIALWREEQRKARTAERRRDLMEKKKEQ